MTVSVCHAASPKNLGRTQHVTIFLLNRFQLIEEVTQLFDQKGVGLCQSPELFRVAIVVG